MIRISQFLALITLFFCFNLALAQPWHFAIQEIGSLPSVTVEPQQVVAGSDLIIAVVLETRGTHWHTHTNMIHRFLKNSVRPPEDYYATQIFDRNPRLILPSPFT